MLANPAAFVAHALFFPIAFYLIRALPVAQGTAVVVVAGMLFLPETIVFSVGDVFGLTKDRVAYLAALLGLLFYHYKAILAARPVLSTFAVTTPMVILNFACWMTNQNSMINEGALQEGLSFAWFLGQTLDDIFTLALPFLIGRAALTTIDDAETVLRVLAGMGIVYTAFIAVELIGAIPFHVFQFSYYLYGIEGRVQLRYGMTEPTVFMMLGHAVSTFMILAVIASVTLRRIGRPFIMFGINWAYTINLGGLLGTLKAASSIVGIGSSIFFSWFKPDRAAKLIRLAALALVLYPFLQTFDLFPEDVLVEIAAQYNEERAGSFGGRFEEEEFVLDGLGDRFWFGWGHFARIPGAAEYGEHTGELGLDAWWIIRLGMAGMLGVELVYLLLAIPVFKARKIVLKLENDHHKWLLCALMLMIVVRMLDLLQNGWWNSIPVFLAGALYGICGTLNAVHKPLKMGQKRPAPTAIPDGT